MVFLLTIMIPPQGFAQPPLLEESEEFDDGTISRHPKLDAASAKQTETLPLCCSKQTPLRCRPEDAAEDVADETFHLVTGYRSDVDYVKDAEDKVADLTYDKKCPSRGTVNKSTCPSYPVMTFNPYRLPSVVVEARCSCGTCLTLAGRSPHACKPIYYYRSVLEVPRRHRQGRPLCYVRVVRRFSVGCQCAFSQREKIASTKTPM
ncbi:uncharacterized protein LOC125374379 [Haliotis rufescens]|uniref:uncharacterized protein LOC125374379 n=1 Tax=Haliotis rufescens TaxID=6454 RepID=UPI00201F03FE|nr:uncharacterized protein LOC125374379 [Haliotis rufescens]